MKKFWSGSQSKPLKNIYNFTLRYISCSLPTRRNLSRWGISPCRRHDSILNFPAKTLHTSNYSNLLLDLPGFKNLSILTSDNIVLIYSYLLQMDVFICLNLPWDLNPIFKIMWSEKRPSMQSLVINQQSEHFKMVNFVNLSNSSLRVFAKESTSFIQM